MRNESRLSDRSGTRVDAQCDQRVAARAAAEHGVLSLAELRACGLTDRAVGVRVRRGHLHRLHKQVYAVGIATPPWEARLLAAVKACGSGSVLSHLSAAMLWGVVERDEDHDPHVTVLGGSTRAHAGIKAHRTSVLPPKDCRRLQGIPITSPARTLLDVASTLHDTALRSAVRRAQGLRIVGVREICEVIARLGPRKGSRRLAILVARGPAPTRTVLEDVVLDLILAGGFVHPDVNKPIEIAGRRVIPDFRWPDQRLIVEADGGSWHGGKVAREDDAERQALLEAHGERVLRVTWEQTVGHVAQTQARFREAGAPVNNRMSAR